MNTSCSVKSVSITVVATLCLALLAGQVQAQSSTSSLRVVVTDTSGAAVGNVNVRITHVPTGRSISATSNAAGVANALGLAVGGPYEVAASGDYAADVMQGIYLELDKTEVIALSVRPVINEVIVTARAPTAEVGIGIGSTFDRSTRLCSRSPTIATFTDMARFCG